MGTTQCFGTVLAIRSGRLRAFRLTPVRRMRRDVPPPAKFNEDCTRRSVSGRLRNAGRFGSADNRPKYRTEFVMKCRPVSSDLPSPHHPGRRAGDVAVCVKQRAVRPGLPLQKRSLAVRLPFITNDLTIDQFTL
jgi:hypothetical protein